MTRLKIYEILLKIVHSYHNHVQYPHNRFILIIHFMIQSFKSLNLSYNHNVYTITSMYDDYKYLEMINNK